MKKLSLLLIAALAVPNMALAATDGTLGATSTGTTEVSLTIEGTPVDEIQITGLTDVIISGVENATNPLATTINNICVYSATVETFSIAIDGANTVAGGLTTDGTLENSDGDIINYAWTFTDNSGNTVVTDTGSALVTSLATGCSDGETASFSIDPFSVFGNVGEVFTDTITITVSPE